jgi:hypothetical protein
VTQGGAAGLWEGVAVCHEAHATGEWAHPAGAAGCRWSCCGEDGVSGGGGELPVKPALHAYTFRAL